MKNVVYGIGAALIGSLVTWLFLQPSFANESAQNASRREMGAACSAKVGPARFTVGDRCFRDEVMVGRWDDNIYCANIEIICN